MARAKLDLNLKPGALKRMMGLPQSMVLADNQKIVDLLEEIKAAPLDSMVINKAGIGKKELKATKLLKERVIMKLNMENWHHGKQKKWV